VLSPHLEVLPTNVSMKDPSDVESGRKHASTLQDDNSEQILGQLWCNYMGLDWFYRLCTNALDTFEANRSMRLGLDAYVARAILLFEAGPSASS